MKSKALLVVLAGIAFLGGCASSGGMQTAAHLRKRKPARQPPSRRSRPCLTGGTNLCRLAIRMRSLPTMQSDPYCCLPSPTNRASRRQRRKTISVISWRIAPPERSICASSISAATMPSTRASTRLCLPGQAPGSAHATATHTAGTTRSGSSPVTARPPCRRSSDGFPQAWSRTIPGDDFFLKTACRAEAGSNRRQSSRNVSAQDARPYRYRRKSLCSGR